MNANTISTNQPSDEAIDITRAAAEYGGNIIKYCYNLLWDYHEAQDAAQEVFLAASVRISDLKNNDAFINWLYRIAYNTCMNILRRKKRQRLFLRLAASGNHIDSYEDNYYFGISMELKNALNTLSAKDRALVYNRAVDEMDYKQLEAIYGTNAAALRKRYERARRKLETELRKGGFDE